MAKAWLCTVDADGKEVLGSDGNLPIETVNLTKAYEIAAEKQRSLRKNFPHLTGDVWMISNWLFKAYTPHRYRENMSWPDYLKKYGNLVYRKESNRV